MKQKEKTESKRNVPRLRFPEFTNAGEWEERKLGEIGDIVSGLTYSPNDLNESGVLVLRSSNIQDGNLSFKDNVFVKTKSYNPVKENDILICVRNGSRNLIGKNALIKKEFEGLAFGAFMSVYRSKYNIFLYQWFSSEFFFEAVKRNLGATINSINGSDLKKFVVAFPSLSEQQKIADCLSSLDEIISLESQKLDSLKSYKKGLLQKLFPAEGETVPQLRFPEFQGAGDWEERKLGEVCKVQDGFAFKSSDFVDNETDAVQVIRITDINNLNKNASKVYVSKSFIVKNYLERYFVGKGDLLLSLTGAAGFNFFIWDGNVSLINQRTAKITPKEKNNQAMLRLIEPLIYDKINVQGEGQNNNLSKDFLFDVNIYIPSHSEQQKIADCLSSIDTLISTQSQKLEELKSHKKGLLQQLFPEMGE